MSFIQAKPTATHDFYAQVHKGLRLALSDLLIRVGSCGGDDPRELATLIADLRTQCEISEHHLANEDLFVHTALEMRAPGASARLAACHEEHRVTFEALESLFKRVETATDAERPARLKMLYLRFSMFVSEDFAHMAEEERLILPVLQSLFTNEELMAIEGEIIATLDPGHMMTFGRAMVPAATRSERIAMMTGIRAAAPPEGFAALMEMSARPTLSESDFAHLCEGLGMAVHHEPKLGRAPM